MNNNCDLGKFILDCIICFVVMTIAIPILFLPSFFIAGTLFEFILQDADTLYYYALALNLSNVVVVFFLKYFYKIICVISSILCCMLFSGFWWLVAASILHDL
ncbi:hypothetical protein [Helicobacter saguini]|uniref:Uncharacterized protein n=1 Tax=Helicobacter saguini TaxID=1548018 RepID=A0A6L7DGR7_9HELI|nr:hypothetical protein [Helicobacter saguini]MWV69496.1 hypothetical protein [Helicobacter saguini]